MAKIDENGSINYSMWQNANAARIAQQVDSDNIKGLSNTGEIFDFVQKAFDEKFQKADINELLGLTLTEPAAGARAANSNTKTRTPEFQKAIDNYNKIVAKINELEYSVIDEDKRICRQLKKVLEEITNKINDFLRQKLSDMEQKINQALEKCEAYQKIVIVPQRYFRYFPFINNYLDSFDIDEIRTLTTTSMASLQTLKQNVEDIIAKASKTEPKNVDKTQYDADALAIKHLGMSYVKFAEKYSSVIDKAKTMTYAGVTNLSPDEADAYYKLKAYAKEMLEITYNEAHKVNWDIGERKLDETIKASGDIYTISQFEYDGITDETLAEIESGITYSAIEETLVNNNNKLETTNVKYIKTDKNDKTWKSIKNGKIVVHKKDKEYNTNGTLRK